MIDGTVFDFGEPVAEKGKRDRRTRFAVREYVGKIVRESESFPVIRRARAARDIHFFADDILEQSLAGIGELFIPFQPRHVCHGDVQVQRAHRVPLRRFLLAHGCVVLMVNGIGECIRLLVVPAALLDEVIGKVEIFFIPRRIVQLYERQLDFGVAAGEKARVLSDVEPLVNIVGVFDHRGVQLIVDARLVQGDRRLD